MKLNRNGETGHSLEGYHANSFVAERANPQMGYMEQDPVSSVTSGTILDIS